MSIFAKLTSKHNQKGLINFGKTKNEVNVTNTDVDVNVNKTSISNNVAIDASTTNITISQEVTDKFVKGEFINPKVLQKYLDDSAGGCGDGCSPALGAMGIAKTLDTRLAKNKSVFAAELAWFAQNYVAKGENPDCPLSDPPALSPDCPYGKFVTQHNLSAEERLLLVLSLIPHSDGALTGGCALPYWAVEQKFPELTNVSHHSKLHQNCTIEAYSSEKPITADVSAANYLLEGIATAQPDDAFSVIDATGCKPLADFIAPKDVKDAMRLYNLPKRLATSAKLNLISPATERGMTVRLSTDVQKAVGVSADEVVKTFMAEHDMIAIKVDGAMLKDDLNMARVRIKNIFARADQWGAIVYFDDDDFLDKKQPFSLELLSAIRDYAGAVMIRSQCRSGFNGTVEQNTISLVSFQGQEAENLIFRYLNHLEVKTELGKKAREEAGRCDRALGNAKKWTAFYMQKPSSKAKLKKVVEGAYLSAQARSEKDGGEVVVTPTDIENGWKTVGHA